MSITALATLLTVAFSFTSRTAFPGFNSLVVIIPTLILILFSQGTIIGWVLSRKVLVGLGLISYPLYLYHQPLISFTLFFNEDIDRLSLVITVLLIGSTLSFLTYRYCEIPIRRRSKTQGGNLQAALLFALTILTATAGLWIAKSEGFPQRLAALNPYAHSIEQAVSSSFHKSFTRGMHIQRERKTKILFVGDSLLQQYIVPLSRHWGYNLNQVDVISRGGCVLLYGVDYEDTFSDISCDQLREFLFNQTHHYEKIVFSQGWHLYGRKILNASIQLSEYSSEIWKPFIQASINRFSHITDEVYVIGPHPQVTGSCTLKISPFTNSQSIENCLRNQSIDFDTFNASTANFSNSLKDSHATILLPLDLWCEENHCSVQENGRPYFKDGQHFGLAATDFLLHQMKKHGW
jgi:hypothetical protein